MYGIPLLAREWIRKSWLHLVSSRTFYDFSIVFWSIFFGKKVSERVPALSKIWPVKRYSKRYISPEWRNSLNIVYIKEFWWEFWLPATFFHGFIAENCLKKVPLKFADSSKIFNLLHKQKRSGRRDAHSIAWSGRGAIKRRLGSKEMVWLRLSLEAERLYILFFSLRCTTTNLYTWKCSSSLCLLITFNIFWVPMWPPAGTKNFESSTLRFIIGKTLLFGKIFCSRIDVFYLAPGCELLKPCCFETAFAKQRLDSIGFCDDKIFFSAKLSLKLG